MAEADTTKPILTSLSFPSVDVTGGGQNITFTAGASDVGLGVNYVSVVFDKAWQDSYGNTTALSAYSSVDSYSDGLSSSQNFINSTSGAGTYHVTGVYVYDKAGNSSYYDGSQLASMGIQNSFTIASSNLPDTTKPILTSLSFPSIVDVTGGSQNITFTAGASDVGLGVNYVSVVFDKAWQDSYGNTTALSAYSSVDSYSDGLSSSQNFINSTSGAGTYHVTGVYVYDKAGNSSYYDGSQLASMGIQNSFTIASSNLPDTTKPILSSLSFPSIVDVTGGGQNITFTAGASDVGLGVNYVSVVFDKAWQDSYGNTTALSAYSSVDSYSDGLSSSQTFINSTSGAGTYHVTGVYVYDKAGNSSYYDGSQLASMGIQNSFTIADRNIAPTATISAPISVAEDGPSSFALSVTIANVTQASGTIFMSFASSQSTVANGTDVSVSNYSGSYSVAQSPAGNYVLTLPSISVFADQLDEGTETLAVTIRASGQIFDTGTDSKTVLIKLIDSHQTGTSGEDTLTGSKFGDELSGLAANDVIRGGLGDDVIDGGSGSDAALFSGLFHQSGLTISTDYIFVAGPDGRDKASNIERFLFDDGLFVLDADSVGAQVTRLYDTVLQRGPDPVGLDYWLDQIQGKGATLNAVAASFLNSPEFQAVTGTLSNTAFVEYVYQHALGRGADGAGSSYWTTQLDGGLSRSSMLIGFSESTEHRALTADLVGKGYFDTDDAYQAVALLYDSFTGRLPDSAGLTFWSEQVKTGARTLTQVANEFAASGEFTNAIAGKDNGQFVDFMYQNTLDRGPDASGRAFWVSQLDAGLTKGALLLSFSQSAEHYSLKAADIIGGIKVTGGASATAAFSPAQDDNLHDGSSLTSAAPASAFIPENAQATSHDVAQAMWLDPSHYGDVSMPAYFDMGHGF